MKKLKKGLFITLDGGEGCGKTTTAKALVDYLSSEGYDVIYTREPGGNKTAEQIRNIMLYNETSPITELFLVAAARSINVKENIIPALNENKIVICDRWDDSTYVYQGYIGGVKAEHIASCMHMCTDGIHPDIKIVLDVDAKEGMKRAAADGHERNKYDEKDLEFYTKVNDGYKNLSGDHISGKDIAIVLPFTRYHVDASRDRESVFEDCKKLILAIIDMAGVEE